MSPVRSVRSLLDVAFPVVGTLLVMASVVLVPDGTVQLLVAVLGVLLLLASILELSRPLFPTERRSLALRMEVDDFIEAVRRVNAAATEARHVDTPEQHRIVERGVEELVARAEHIGRLAGQAHAAPAGNASAVRATSGVFQ